MFHEILAAWSTFAAVILAVILALIPLLFSIWKRPSLHLEANPEYPQSFTEGDMHNEPVHHIRIAVRNRGRTQSESTWIRCIRYSLLKDTESKNLKLHHIIDEPCYFLWSGFKDVKHISIPAGSYHFASLVTTWSGAISLNVGNPSPYEIYGIDLPDARAGFYCLKVSFGSDKTKPSTRYIVFELGGKDEMLALGEGESPAKALDMLKNVKMNSPQAQTGT